MIRALTALLLVGLASLACQGVGNATPGPDIIIASDLPTSAFQSADVRTLEQAIGFAIRQQSTIEGYKLGYLPLDNALGAEQSQLRGRENVRRMIADRRVLGMVGPHSSFVGQAEMPEANLAHLAMVSPSTTSYCLTLTDPSCTQTNPASLRPTGEINYFRISPSDPLQGKAMARFAATHLNVRRVALFNEFDDGPIYVREFSDELAKFGGEIVLQQDLAFGTTDFSGFLKAAQARHVDAVAGIGPGGYNACFVAAQMSKLLPGVILFGIDGMALDDSCVQDAGPTPARFYATYPDVDPRTSTDPMVKQRVGAYVAAHPKPSDVTVYTFAAYDCARILIDAIDRAIKANGGKIPSRRQVVTALTQTKDFVGVTGTYTFDANGDAVSPMISMYQLQGGRWVNVPL
jgi:branched-chain amino acid transport system substrate-binding protein